MRKSFGVGWVEGLEVGFGGCWEPCLPANRKQTVFLALKITSYSALNSSKFFNICLKRNSFGDSKRDWKATLVTNTWGLCGLPTGLALLGRRQRTKTPSICDLCGFPISLAEDIYNISYIYIYILYIAYDLVVIGTYFNKK